MIRQFCWSAVALVLFVSTAAAQGAAGTWNGKSMIGAKDSVITTYVLTIAADGKSGTLTYPDHDPIELRVVAMGGDSLVTEAGPYPSILRPGQTVTLLRTVARVKGNNMTGMYQVTFGNGDVVRGKTQATRTK